MKLWNLLSVATQSALQQSSKLFKGIVKRNIFKGHRPVRYSNCWRWVIKYCPILYYLLAFFENCVIQEKTFLLSKRVFCVHKVLHRVRTIPLQETTKWRITQYTLLEGSHKKTHLWKLHNYYETSSLQQLQTRKPFIHAPPKEIRPMLGQLSLVCSHPNPAHLRR